MPKNSTRKAHLSVATPKEGAAFNVSITVVNDGSLPTIAVCSNNFLGLVSLGYALPGQSVALPCSPALWDVYLVFETSSAVILNGWAGSYAINYSKMKSNVSWDTTLKVSDF